MKLILVLLLFIAALPSMAQNKRDQPNKADQQIVSVSFDGDDLPRCLEKLEKQSGIRFFYDAEEIKKIKNSHSRSFTNAAVADVLYYLLDKSGISFEVVDDKKIVLHKKISGNEPAPVPEKKSGPPQKGPGAAMKGRVVDFETSQPLPGATVRLEGTDRSGASDEKGYYRLGNIKAGEYSLIVSYTGYSTFRQTIKVEKDGITFDVRMQAGGGLSEVVVSSAGRKVKNITNTTERQMLSIIKNSRSVVSGISAEQIGKGADRNAAEVVRRISGVTVRDDKFIIIRGMNERYNLTYLNGNVAPSTELYSRAFSLDLIPTRIIDRILVYKSPAPDLLGDMTGGAVKIFTKDAKNVRHFDLELQLGYRDNTTFHANFLTYQGGKFDFLGFDDGTRKLPSSVPNYGNFTRANISQAAYAQTFSPILQYGRMTGLPTGQLTANYYNTFKVAGKRLSLLSSLSYKNESIHLGIARTQGNLTTDDSAQARGTVVKKVSQESQNTQTAQISLLQNFTWHIRDSSSIYFKNFLLHQGQNSTILRDTKTNQQIVDGKWNNGLQTGNIDLRDIILSYNQRFLYSGNLGGSHVFGRRGRQLLEWNGGYTYSRLEIPDQRAIHLQNNVNHTGVAYVGDYEQNWVPVTRDETGFSTNALELGIISRLWIRNTEQVYNGSADYTMAVLPWLTLKAGAYQQWKQREVFRRAYTVNEGDVPASGFTDVFNSGIGATVPEMNLNTVFFHQQDLGQVWSPNYLRDDGTGLKVFDRTNGSDAYVATEQNNSGYVAASLLPFRGKLDIYGGLRVEYDRQKVAGALAGTNGGVNRPVLADLKSTLYLPSVNIGYRPDNSWVVRAAYGKTVNRPEFRELSPYSELDYINNQSIQGNNNLVFATVTNYDARVEWYPHGNAKGESISIGGFYKQIQHPIERVVFKNYSVFLPTQATNIDYINADKAKVYGLELDLHKDLSFVPLGVFRRLSIVANGSYIFSKATRHVGDTATGYYLEAGIDRQLQGQAPYNVNLGLYYDNAGSGTRIGIIYNEVGPRIYAAALEPANRQGDGPYQGSLIELTRRQLDLSVTQRIVKSLQARFTVQNLLNDPVQIAEDANFTYKYEKAHLSKPGYVNGGATVPATISGDLLASDYRPGRFFLITLTYSF